jgi:NADP-dependent 3-hydroxy acid dehydrogenase YdfG
MNKYTVFITGCTPDGIGYATAKHLKKLGHRVFASARRQEVVDTLISEGFEAYLVDVNNYTQVD